MSAILSAGVSPGKSLTIEPRVQKEELVKNTSLPQRRKSLATRVWECIALPLRCIRATPEVKSPSYDTDMASHTRTVDEEQSFIVFNNLLEVSNAQKSEIEAAAFKGLISVAYQNLPTSVKNTIETLLIDFLYTELQEDFIALYAPQEENPVIKSLTSSGSPQTQLRAQISKICKTGLSEKENCTALNGLKQLYFLKPDSYAATPSEIRFKNLIRHSICFKTADSMTPNN